MSDCLSVQQSRDYEKKSKDYCVFGGHKIRQLMSVFGGAGLDQILASVRVSGIRMWVDPSLTDQ